MKSLCGWLSQSKVQLLIQMTAVLSFNIHPRFLYERFHPRIISNWLNSLVSNLSEKHTHAQRTCRGHLYFGYEALMINSLYDTLLKRNQNVMCCTFNPDTTMNRKAIKETNDETKVKTTQSSEEESQEWERSDWKEDRKTGERTAWLKSARPPSALD